MHSTRKPPSLASSQKLSHSPQNFQNPLVCPEVPLTLSINHKQAIGANDKQQGHARPDSSQSRSRAGAAVSVGTTAGTELPAGPPPPQQGLDRENYGYSLGGEFSDGFASD